MWWASSRSKIVPFGAGILNVSLLVAIVPDAVPAKKKRRFGYVCASTELKYRWPNGKYPASECEQQIALVGELHRDGSAGADEAVVAPVVVGLVRGVPGLRGRAIELARRWRAGGEH